MKSRPTPRIAKDLAGGERVDVGGRRPYVHCTGSGSPTVVLEAGLDLDSNAWSIVLAALRRMTRTCAYDRAGLGVSGAIPGVH